MKLTQRELRRLITEVMDQAFPDWRSLIDGIIDDAQAVGLVLSPDSDSSERIVRERRGYIRFVDPATNGVPLDREISDSALKAQADQLTSLVASRLRSMKLSPRPSRNEKLISRSPGASGYEIDIYPTWDGGKRENVTVHFSLARGASYTGGRRPTF